MAIHQLLLMDQQPPKARPSFVKLTQLLCNLILTSCKLGISGGISLVLGQSSLHLFERFNNPGDGLVFPHIAAWPVKLFLGSTNVFFDLW